MIDTYIHGLRKLGVSFKNILREEESKNERHKVASITRVENVIFNASVKDLETSLILSVKRVLWNRARKDKSPLLIFRSYSDPAVRKAFPRPLLS